MYVDGAAVSTVSAGGRVATFPGQPFGSYQLFIGGRNGPTAPLQGLITGVLAFSTGLSSYCISELYLLGLSGVSSIPTVMQIVAGSFGVSVMSMNSYLASAYLLMNNVLTDSSQYNIGLLTSGTISWSPNSTYSNYAGNIGIGAGGINAFISNTTIPMINGTVTFADRGSVIAGCSAVSTTVPSAAVAAASSLPIGSTTAACLIPSVSYNSVSSLHSITATFTPSSSVVPSSPLYGPSTTLFQYIQSLIQLNTTINVTNQNSWQNPSVVDQPIAIQATITPLLPTSSTTLLQSTVQSAVLSMSPNAALLYTPSSLPALSTSTVSVSLWFYHPLVSSSLLVYYWNHQSIMVRTMHGGYRSMYANTEEKEMRKHTETHTVDTHTHTHTHTHPKQAQAYPQQLF